ncbi:MAG: TraX protein [Lachnospiraceae bacterium]|nr:TraX protein [Lachnospiraceae bacterium]
MNTQKTVTGDNIIGTIKSVGIDGTTLKWIALVTMVIDHLAAVFLHSGLLCTVLRSIGRLSFPIFAFLIVQGYMHTRNRNKYALRLLLFAIISEIPYDLAFYNTFFVLRKQNIFFTLLAGLVAIRIMDYITNEMKFPDFIVDKGMVVMAQSAAEIAVILPMCFLAEKVNLCYSFAGILIIVLFYSLRDSKSGILWANVMFALMYGGIQLFGIAAILPLYLYNNKPGDRRYKWLFYIFYPAHLLLFWGIRKLI